MHSANTSIFTTIFHIMHPTSYYMAHKYSCNVFLPIDGLLYSSIMDSFLIYLNIFLMYIMRIFYYLCFQYFFPRIKKKKDVQINKAESIYYFTHLISTSPRKEPMEHKVLHASILWPIHSYINSFFLVSGVKKTWSI